MTSINLEKKSMNELDTVIVGIIERNMKLIAWEHARKSGATEEWIASTEKLSSRSVWQVVTALYGDPA